MYWKHSTLSPSHIRLPLVPSITSVLDSTTADLDRLPSSSLHRGPSLLQDSTLGFQLPWSPPQRQTRLMWEKLPQCWRKMEAALVESAGAAAEKQLYINSSTPWTQEAQLQTTRSSSFLIYLLTLEQAE